MGEEGGILGVKLSEVDLDSESAAQLPDLSPGPYMLLTVSDTGHGMDKAVMERIFEPYFTTKEKERGTGLGLSVVRGIVTSYGGAITVYSEPGEGTTFHVYLPRIGHVEEIHEPEAEERPPTGHERILLIDDDLMLVHMGKQMLERLGYAVVTRTSGVEALGLFGKKSDHFDLVITDMTMPQMTGDKLARELIRIRSDIPIILCTAFSEHISKEKATAMGVRGFFMKPFLINEIAKVVRKVLDKD
jgi:CheY-like chemotaxis protein